MVKLIILGLHESFEGVGAGVFCSPLLPAVFFTRYVYSGVAGFALRSLLCALRSFLDSRALVRVHSTFFVQNTVSFLYDIERALLHLIVDPRQILAQQPDSDKLDAPQEENESHKGRESGLSYFDAEESSQNEETSQGKSDGTDEDADGGHHFQRFVGETEDGIQGVFDQALKDCLGSPPARSWRS